MLVIGLEPAESVYLFDRITHRVMHLTCVRVTPNNTRIGFDVPDSITIVRQQVVDKLGDGGHAQAYLNHCKQGAGGYVTPAAIGRAVLYHKDRYATPVAGVIQAILPVDLSVNHIQLLLKLEDETWLVVNEDKIVYAEYPSAAQQRIADNMKIVGGRVLDSEVVVPLVHAAKTGK